MAVLLGFIICASITWQPSPLYDFLNWVRDYIVLVCIVTVLAGWVVISFYFISKPIKQLDVVANAAEQLSRPSEEPIQLPDSLEDISIQLNLAREQALRDARAAREAEQRKNDLIVYLAHDLKTPLTSIINYVDLIWQNAAAFLTVCVVSMVLTYGATAWAVHLTRRLMERGGKRK